jgi:hypothetical protein
VDRAGRRSRADPEGQEEHRMKVFSIFDCKAEAYLEPFFASTSGLAARRFEEAARNEESQFHKHASDYTLFEIGDWDEMTGELRALETKISLGVAVEYLTTGERDNA